MDEQPTFLIRTLQTEIKMIKHDYQTLKKHKFLYFTLAYLCFFNISLRGMSPDESSHTPEKTARYYYLKAINSEETDIEKSVRNLRKSADLNHSDAAFKLGSRYFYGDGIPQQEQEGLRYLRIAAAHGNAAANQLLSIIERHALQSASQNSRASGPSSSLETVSKYSKLSCDVSWVLKDCMDIASTCLYFLGYEGASKILDKGSLLTKFFWGASKITHGTSETIRTGEKKHLLSIGSGLVCIGSSYLQYKTREEYHNLLLQKEALGKEKKAIKSQIKEIEDKKEKLGTDSQMEESWDELNRSLITKKGTLSALDEERKNRSFQILGIECADEVCTRTAEDISEGKDIKSSIAKNLAMVVLRKLPHSTVKENSERIRSRIKELLEATKARVMEKMFGTIEEHLDVDPALYFIPPL